MPMASALTFASACTLTMQFLIFVYLYSFHRERFFHYLLLAWGLMSLAKGLYLARAFVPNLDRHLAACDLALVQGGLTTCMELTAAGTPFLYFPLKNHFEQNFHVAHRLDRYGAGRRMEFATSTPSGALSEAGSMRGPATTIMRSSGNLARAIG